jgi:hypothetical protein
MNSEASGFCPTQPFDESQNVTKRQRVSVDENSLISHELGKLQAFSACEMRL